MDCQLVLPHVAFNRHIGEFSKVRTDISGRLLSELEWEAQKSVLLPTSDDNAFIDRLMKPVRHPGAFAGWIAPPKVGIDNKPGHFEYVKLEGG